MCFISCSKIAGSVKTSRATWKAWSDGRSSISRSRGWWLVMSRSSSRDPSVQVNVGAGGDRLPFADLAGDEAVERLRCRAHRLHAKSLRLGGEGGRLHERDQI